MSVCDIMFVSQQLTSNCHMCSPRPVPFESSRLPDHRWVSCSRARFRLKALDCDSNTHKECVNRFHCASHHNVLLLVFLCMVHVFCIGRSIDSRNRIVANRTETETETIYPHKVPNFVACVCFVNGWNACNPPLPPPPLPNTHPPHPLLSSPNGWG